MSDLKSKNCLMSVMMAFVLLIFCFIAVIVFITNRTVAINKVTHTYEVINAVNQFKYNIVIAERQEKEYLLTSNAIDLDMDRTYFSNLTNLFIAVKNLTRDNNKIQDKIGLVQSSLDQLIQLSHHVSPQSAKGIIERLKEIDTLTNGIIADEYTLLNERLDYYQIVTLYAYFALVVSAILSFTLLVTYILKIASLQKQNDQQFLDLNKRIEAERIANIRLEFALETSKFGSWDYNLSTKEVSRSLRHDKIFGYDKFLPQWNYVMFVAHLYPEDREYVEKKLEEAISSFSDYELTYRIIRADKKLAWIWVKARCIRIDDQIHMIGLIQDISEKKQAEDELYYMQERTKMLVDKINDYAIYMLNPLGYILTWNQGARHITGYTTEQIIGHHFSLLHTDDDIKRSHPEYELEVAKSNGSYEEEGWRRRANGTKFWAKINIYPLHNKKGVLVGFTKIIRDLTERLTYERNLEKKNIALESAVQAKNKFLASMSHELRTPLNAIIGFTGVLLMRLPGPLNAEQEKQLNTVKNSATYLLSIINDLLDIARIESGRLELLLENIDVVKLVQDIVLSLSTLAVDKNLTLSVRMGDAIKTNNGSLMTVTDRRALNQIVINLINNAIKYTQQGGIEVKLEKSSVDQVEYLLISVIDTGRGIKPEEYDMLFKPFKQFSSEDRSIEGSGLGLFLSQKLASILGGKIIVESTYGLGSKFTLILPLKGVHKKLQL